MLLFDSTHTSHTRAQTGIQRVCRSLFGELTRAGGVTAVIYDPYLKSWRPGNARELGFLQPGKQSGGSRSAQWPLPQRLAGHAARLLGTGAKLPAADGLICPELFSSQVGTHLPEIFARVRGPRVAIFYDAIPLKFPELTPNGTVARLPAYLRELLQFDGVAAISADSAASLRDYWQWLGVTETPPVAAIPLGVDPLNPTATAGSAPNASHPLPRILSVGTIEGRKNHLALLSAVETLWAEGMQFELQLLGLARPDTARPALDRIAALQHAGRPLFYEGSASEDNLHAAYRACLFTVYPSLLEGFGLPVLESLQHGRPCICSGHGALAESARGGGCVALDSVDSASLTDAMRTLLQNPAKLAAVTTAARARQLQTWTGYASAFTTWMQTLKRRT